MKRAAAALAAFLLTASMLPVIRAQSLADLAKKEKERREKVQSSAKTVTNDDLGKYKGGAITTETLPPAQKPESEAGKQDSEAARKTTNPASDEPTDLQGRPESFWRQTLGDVRQKVKDLEREANVLTLKLADLQMQFYRESSGYRQQDIQREIQKTFYEQDQNKQALAQAKDQLQDLEKEARKSGALPGWILPKNP